MLSEEAEAELVERLEVVPVAVEVGAEDDEDALRPAEEDHGDEDGEGEDAWGHAIERVDVDFDRAEEFEVREKLEEAEGVEEGGKAVKEDLELPKLGCCLEAVELFL